jgi:hypothetical protein
MERLFWSRLRGMVASAGIPTKTNKEIRDLIIQSSDKRCTYCSIWLRYSNFSLALTRSVKDFDKNYFVPYPNPTSEIISVRFPKVLIKERLFLYRFRPKVLERQVSSPRYLFIKIIK